MKVGLVLEGGFMRGAYVAGALRALADLGLTTPEVICSVSVSGFSASYFIAGQYSELMHLWKNLVTNSDLVGWRIWLSTRKMYNVRRLVYHYFAQVVPLNKQAVKNSPTTLYYTATDCLTGEPVYLSNHESGDIFYKMIASSSNRHVNPHEYVCQGRPCCDGGFSDPIPLAKALAEGCEKIILIKTKKGYLQEYVWLMHLAKFFWPKIYHFYKNQSAAFAKTHALIEELRQKGRILVIEPQKITRYSKVTTNNKKTRRWVEMGYQECLQAFAANPDFLPVKDPKEFLFE